VSVLVIASCSVSMLLVKTWMNSTLSLYIPGQLFKKFLAVMEPWLSPYDMSL
jgi:hypothetical protein